MTLRIVEHYVSIQGEGPRTGIMTQFVRFAGCNLRCPGWPCDTQFAILPKIWAAPGGHQKASPDDVVEAALAFRKSTGAENVCLTGGEPLIQPADDLRQMVIGLQTEGFGIEVFTNGTQPLPTWVEETGVVLDWKLGGSGESSKAIEARLENVASLEPHHVIKFVVKDYDDLVEAAVLTDTLKTSAHYFVGAVWGAITDDEIVDFIKVNKLNWRLNVQVHKHIWDPNARRT